MTYYLTSATTPTLRRLYRAAKTIAKAANEGDKIMCPCGCLKQFHKKSKSQIFLNSKSDKCKDRYYSRTRSKANYAYTQGMLKILREMNAYVNKNKAPKLTPKKKEKIIINSVKNEPSAENYVEILNQVKNASKSAEKGSRVMCPCGCMKTFIKSTGHHTFSRDNGEECKDSYWTTVRSDDDIEMSAEKMIAFKVMRNYVEDSIKEENKIKSKKLSSKRRKL